LSNIPPVQQSTNLRDYVQNPLLVPSWLRGPITGPFMVSMAIQFDALVDACAFAIRARFPSVAPTDAFTWLQQDRQIDQGFQEPLASYIVRLLQWLDLWRLAGSAYGVLLALYGYIAPDQIAMWHVSNNSVWDGYDANAGASPPQNGILSYGFVPPGHIDDPSAGVWNWDDRPWQWWRFWVILYPDAALWTQGKTWGSFHYGDGTLYGLGGPGATSGTGPSLKSLIKKWKTQGAFSPSIILAWDPTWFLPSSPSSKLPDGSWGADYTVVTIAGVRQYAIARNQIAATCIDGPII
jgi:hypothetical protein